MKKLCAIFLIVLSAAVVNAQVDQDKKLHFLAGGLASSYGYTYTYDKTKNKTKATFAGIGLAMLAGAIKETIDSRQHNNKFDLEDLAATTLGGITIGVTINLFNNDRKSKKIRKRRLDLGLGKT